MINKLVTFFILYIFSAFLLSISVFPISIIINSLIFSFSSLHINYIQIIISSAIISLFALLILYIIHIVSFYSNHHIKKKIQNIILYDKTQYKQVIDILLDNLKQSLHIPENWLKIYIDPSSQKKSIYSFGNIKIGNIVISKPMMIYIIDLIKKNSEQALQFLKALLTHEISHLSHYDYIVADFFKINQGVLKLMQNIFTLPILMLKKTFLLIPQKHWRNFVIIIFHPIEICLSTIFSPCIFIFNKIFKMLRFSLMQFAETRADKDTIHVNGLEAFSNMLKNIPHYSSIFSFHKPAEKRFSKVRAIKKMNFKIIFNPDLKDTNIILHIVFSVTSTILIFILSRYINIIEIITLIKQLISKII